MKCLRLLLVLTAGLAIGVALCAAFPKIPAKVAEMINDEDSIIEHDPPTLEQINEVLTGSLSLVEAQFTYYVHVTRNTKFAPNIRELGLGFGFENPGGTVMVLDVWNASDAIERPSPLHGYLFKCLPVAIAPEKKNGFLVAAYPAEKGSEWPLYVSIIPDARGGLIGMSSRDTWEIEDTDDEIRAMLQRSDLALSDLEKFSPERSPKSRLIEIFKKTAE
jgi:hypothetical protein